MVRESIKRLTRDVTSDNRFQRDHFRFPHKHRTPLELVPVLSDLLWHLSNIGRHNVVGNDVLELVEPEERYIRQDFALVRNTLARR